MMMILFITLSDHNVIVALLNNKQLERSESFHNIKDFLTSSFWKDHKKTPRFIYINQENAYSLLNLKGLSWFDKTLLVLRYKILKGDSLSFLISADQMLLASLELPVELKEGPLLKTASILVYCLQVLEKKQRDFPTLYYYHAPSVGLWQLAFEGNTLLFYTLNPVSLTKSLKESLEESRQQMGEHGILDVMDTVDLAPLMQDKVCLMHSLLYPKMCLSPYHPRFFPSYFHKAIAALFFLIFSMGHTIFSIRIWEQEVQKAKFERDILREKTERDPYRILKEKFEAQGNTHAWKRKSL